MTRTQWKNTNVSRHLYSFADLNAMKCRRSASVTAVTGMFTRCCQVFVAAYTCCLYLPTRREIFSDASRTQISNFIEVHSISTDREFLHKTFRASSSNFCLNYPFTMPLRQKISPLHSVGYKKRRLQGACDICKQKKSEYGFIQNNPCVVLISLVVT